MKIAIVGAGNMARVRARALQARGGEICAVASKHRERAQALAGELGVEGGVDDYRDLLRFRPDAVLIEVPHQIQDEVAVWALQSGLHTLIGGCLGTNASVALQIGKLAQENSLVVEAGYEARYSNVWRRAKEHLRSGDIGEAVAIRTLALFPADPRSWYYDEQQSGGMILTHMTYTFVNPIRWIFGPPLQVSAFSNRKNQTGPGYVKHETCTANFLFGGDVLCNMTAGYVRPAALDAWNVSVLGTDGSLEFSPGDLTRGSLTLYARDGTVRTQKLGEDRAFEDQATAFLSSITGAAACLNPPDDAYLDVRIAEVIAESAERAMTLPFAP